ncbi:protoporphyrinogen/coproporphyrinogen oxidase [Herbiconiux solani]|uniref:protoporphyrinogen/coproporphyrinogen oxidase n=1 Tax=Herbiconiux solani TaxID=661329 RepID=UPI000825289D|nr:FAD-dependent oxidoreductase [Herbiconiux solani]
MTDQGSPSPHADSGARDSDFDFDVVVIGGGAGGLVAARQLAHLGNTVLVVEAREALGGFVGRHELAGVVLDSGAESFATRRGTVAAFVTELGLDDRIVVPAKAGAWVAWTGGTAPLPAAGILGIPGVPLADDVRRVIGWGGSLRAYLDRLMPLLRVKPEHDLGDIVRRRMGRKVLDRLVTPVVAGVHSADPSIVDVRSVAPGLTQAMTTQGSLSGAVMALREQAPAGSQVQGIAGGVHTLIDALEADARYYGVEFRTATRVSGLERGAATDVDGEGWVVRTDPVPFGADGGTDGADGAETRGSAPIRARAVIMATDFRPALDLLTQAGVGRPASGSAEAAPATGASPTTPALTTPALPAADEWPTPASVTIATLVVDDARLDAAPRGTGVLVAPGTQGVTAKALTHATAKWAWLAESLPAHRHVLRLSYGRADATGRADAAGSAAAPTTAGAVGARPPAPAAARQVDSALALQDASTLLGIRLSPATVVDFDTVQWRDSLAFATLGHKARVAEALAAVAVVPGLDVVGAWVSGTGLAATIAEARTTASALAAELRGDRRLPTD